MHAENLGVVDHGQRVDIVSELAEWVEFGRVIDARGGILVARLESLGREKALQNGAQTSLVPEIGHTAAVSDLARDVDERVPRNVAVFAEHLEVREGALAVRVVEFVFDVPAERAEFLALLDDRVEEANTEYDFFPFLAQDVLLKEGRLDLGKCTLRIRTNSLLTQPNNKLFIFTNFTKRSADVESFQ